jgi:hypothetical protein
MPCGASSTKAIRTASSAEKYGQTVWSILTSVGIAERSLGLHASAQEILARPYYPRHDSSWSPDRIVSGIRYRAVHIHAVLIQNVSAIAAQLLRDAFLLRQTGEPAPFFVKL